MARKPKKLLSELSPKTVWNRRWQLNKLAKALGMPSAIAKVSRTKKAVISCRLRAARGNLETVTEVMLRKHEAMETWRAFIAAIGGKGVYRSAVTQLQERLTSDLSLRTTTKGAYLDPKQQLGLFIHLLLRDGMCDAHGWFFSSTPTKCMAEARSS